MYRPYFDRNCSKCNLTCGTAVTGQSVIPFEEVMLIVISAYPGVNEVQQNISLAPATNKKKKGVNAGEYLRFCLNQLIKDSCLPEPITKYTYYTNAVKCNPFQNKVYDSHVFKCKETWLDNELSMFNPKVPILLASSQAVKAVLGRQEKLYENTNKIIYYNQHPCIVTPNPIEWERGVYYKIDNYENVLDDLIGLHRLKKATKYQIDKLINLKSWDGIPIGSSNYFVKRDLNLLKQEIIKYVRKSNN
jgi:hypothetical protein